MSILGSVSKALTDPGAMVQDAIGSLLPKEVSGAVGHIAAGVVDLYAGKELQAVQHGLAALANLPQLAKSAASALSSLTAGGSTKFEPSPPGGNAGQVVASGSWRNPTALQSLLKQLLQSPLSSITTTSTGLAGHLAVAASPSPNGSPVASSSTTTPHTSGTSPASTSSSAAGSPKNIQDLTKMSDADFMNAIRNGKIPDDVKNDPAAMMQIQDRMNQISQMNQLMTSMMQAMHQMEMAIIQNVRV